MRGGRLDAGERQPDRDLLVWWFPRNATERVDQIRLADLEQSGDGRGCPEIACDIAVQPSAAVPHRQTRRSREFIVRDLSGRQSRFENAPELLRIARPAQRRGGVRSPVRTIWRRDEAFAPAQPCERIGMLHPGGCPTLDRPQVADADRVPDGALRHVGQQPQLADREFVEVLDLQLPTGVEPYRAEILDGVLLALPPSSLPC